MWAMPERHNIHHVLTVVVVKYKQKCCLYIWFNSKQIHLIKSFFYISMKDYKTMSISHVKNLRS